MRKLRVFNQVSLDGFFVDAHGDMSWAHKNDPEWLEFTAENSSSGGELVFGRVTYQMMANFWPTPAARAMNAELAERMNNLPKIVFSRTMETAAWKNTRLVGDDLIEAVKKLKNEEGSEMVILGSGQVVSQLTAAHLVDEYQLVVNPLVLGQGRTLFAGVTEKIDLHLTNTRAFKNGNVVLSYSRRV